MSRWDDGIDWDKTYICEGCGEVFEPFQDSYCGRTFVEKGTCPKCSESDGIH